MIRTVVGDRAKYPSRDDCLGTNQKALKRRLARIGLYVLHTPPPRAAQKPAVRTVVRARVAA